jgi:hypothetical protein
MFGVTNPVGVTCSGTGEGRVDFGMFLLSLLSMESLPVEFEHGVGEGSETSGGAIPGSDKGGLTDVLLTALRSGEQAVPLTGIETGSQVESWADLLLKSADIAMEAPEHTPFAYSPPAVPVEYVTPAGKTQIPLDNLRQSVTQPAKVETLLAALQHIGVPLPVIPTHAWAGTAESAVDQQMQAAAPAPAAGEIQLTEDQTALSTPRGESVSITGIKVEESSVNLSSVVHNGTGSGAAIPVMPANDQHRIIWTEIPETAAKTIVESAIPTPTRILTVPTNFTGTPLAEAVEAQGIPATLTTGTQTTILSSAAPDATALQGQLVTKPAACFPETEIEALNVPVTKNPAAKAESTSESGTKISSRPVNVTAQAVAAIDTRGQKQEQGNFAALNRESAQETPMTLLSKIAAAPAAPELSEGLKIKTQATQLPADAEIKPTTLPTGAETAPAVKTETTAGKSEEPRTQFILEPESLRTPLKVPAEIRLRLVPESLGMVKLTIRALENHLSARVVVQSPAAQMTVERNLADLQRTLADAGLVIDKFEVTVGHTLGTSPSHPDADPHKRRYTYRQKANRRYQEAAGTRESASAAAVRAGAGGAAAGPGTLNMMA